MNSRRTTSASILTLLLVAISIGIFMGLIISSGFRTNPVDQTMIHYNINVYINGHEHVDEYGSYSYGPYDTEPDDDSDNKPEIRFPNPLEIY